MGRTIAGRPVRMTLATTAVVIFVARFGIMAGSAGLQRFMDIATAVVAILFAAGVFLPAFGKTLKERVLDERWLFLFTVLFTTSLVSLVFKGFSGGGAWPIGLALQACRIYIFLCAMRVLLGEFGSWALDHLKPWAILPVTFGLVIVIGTGLLMLPGSTPSDRGIEPVDAFFTSASATCVTGLVVMDTGSDFTNMGQIVILMLIQVGGLGLMTFVAFFAMFLGQSAGLKESMSLGRVMDSEFVTDLKRLLASIVGWTLAIESAGAFILYLIWKGQDLGWSTTGTIWQSVFHSISAFCNAGFSLNPVPAGAQGPASNLEGFANVPGIPLTIGLLIVLGGLGFLVLTSMGSGILHRLRTGNRKRLPLQARLVLIITGMLIVAGFLLFLALEWDNTLKGMDLPQKISNAFLGSVTPRTAGFNTVPTAGLLPVVKWAFIALMFIGASPGGTGGGIKTTTVGLVLIGFISMARRRNATELWKRHIPSPDLKRAAAVMLFGMIVFTVSTGVLLAVETDASGSGDWEPMDYVFESMSAFGTVGLSTGVTPDLTGAGKLAIICTMFLGRIGPAALAAATGSALASRYRYPEAKITIG